jgi:site-specific recombinase XerC
MLAQGTDLYVVSEILGHSSVAITEDVYGHLVPGANRLSKQCGILLAKLSRRHASERRQLAVDFQLHRIPLWFRPR